MRATPTLPHRPDRRPLRLRRSRTVAEASIRQSMPRSRSRIRATQLDASTLAPPLRSKPPAWVETFLTGTEILHGGTAVAVGQRLVWRRAGHFTLLEGTVEDATELPAQAFLDAVASVYRSIAHELNRQARHSVRIWNFVPDIQGRLANGDRYMTFNEGRFLAYRDSFGGTDAFAFALPTASAIGVSDRALTVHVLAADTPGWPVENPRQIPSYRYSPRYGARPPCFARATRLGSTLFIGGTASILGEDTRHEGDVHAQTRESCANIAALIDAAGHSASSPMKALRSARVHVRHAHDAPDARTAIAQAAPHLTDVEVVQAPLCRRDLLVEIEGVADCA